MRIGIVGAGIGGLAAAALLAQACIRSRWRSGLPPRARSAPGWWCSRSGWQCFTQLASGIWPAIWGRQSG